MARLKAGEIDTNSGGGTNPCHATDTLHLAAALHADENSIFPVSIL
jgi:hypothetical protein